MDFIQHLFFLTLEDNLLPADFVRGMDDLGALTFLLTREISQPKESDAASKRPARPRPTMQRLASQYGTLRGHPGAAPSTPFPAFVAAPMSHVQVPDSSSASLEVPSSGKARRFSSPGRRNLGTGSLTPATARVAALATQDSANSPISIGKSQPQAAFMGSSSTARGQMPPLTKFKEAFEHLLEDIDLSGQRRDELLRGNPEEKWKLLRLYKGPLLELLSNNVEKLNRDRKFEEWQKRDKKLKALADAHASAEVFVSSLRQGTLSMTEMTSLRLLLDVAPLPYVSICVLNLFSIYFRRWIYQFLDSGGLLHTINYLEKLVFRADKSAQDIVCESGSLAILAYFLKNDNIASLVLTSPDAVKTITLCLKAPDPLTRRGALELLFDLSKIHSFAPRLISSALESMSQEHPFSVLIDILGTPQSATSSVHDHAMCLAVVNRLLESQVDIISRYRVRSQMLKLGIESALLQLNPLPDDLLQSELSKWDTSAARDEEEIKRLAAQDYRVLARLQEGESIPAGAPSVVVPEGLSPSGETELKPQRAFKLAEKRVRSVSVGVMASPLSLAFPSSANSTPRTPTSASSDPSSTLNTARRAIRVLVADIGSLSLLFTDTTSVVDVTSKIHARHELNRDKFGLFYVGTDEISGKVEGSWLKDPSAKITHLLEKKPDAVWSYKALPWRMTVECPVQRCTLNVEVESSWTVGQATAHIVTSNSSSLSLDLEYDLFAGAVKLDESSMLSSHEAALFSSAAASATTQLFARPEMHRIYFAGDLAPVSVEVDSRAICGDVLLAAVAKCSPPLLDSTEDLALCLEGRAKQPKRGSTASSRSDKDAADYDSDGRKHWLQNDQPFWSSFFDKRRHKLRVALRPREVFVSILDDPVSSSSSVGSEPQIGMDSILSVAAEQTPSAPESLSGSLPLGSPALATLPDAADIDLHRSALAVTIEPMRTASSSSLAGADDDSDSEVDRLPSSSSEVCILLGFDESVSSLIHIAMRRLRRVARHLVINYTLFKGDKLLNRQKTLKEVGVGPGDHLILKSIDSRQLEHATVAAAGTNSAGALSDEQSDDVDIHAEEDDGSGKLSKFEGAEHTTRALSAASLNQLILRLTDPGEYDKSFMETFLLTYRSFTSPEVVLAKIMQRYRAPADRVGADKVDTVRVRCLVFMTNWLDKSFQDLNDRVLERMNIWIETDVEPERRSVLLKTLNRVRERIMEVEIPAAISIRFKGTAPRFIELEPDEIARQLTLDTWILYSKVKPIEFFDCAWAKPKLQHLAPNVLALIARFNFYAQWVVSEIVGERRLKSRKQVWNKFIRVAEQLRLQNNFHVMYAIITAFSNSAVSRLKWTLEKLNKQSRQSMQDLETLMAMEGSFRNYRDALQQVSSSPCIPYVGVPLKDLTFIEDGNPNVVDNLVNWAKRKLVFDVVGNFLGHQIVPYRISPISIGEMSFDEILRSLPTLEEAEQFRLSLESEPRGAKLESLVQ